MKKYILWIVMACLPFSGMTRNLWAFLSYSAFNSPEGPYVETYLTVAGNSVIFLKKDNGKFQATVNILMTFKQAGAIKAFKKYELNSPEVADTAGMNMNFLDEQRFQVPNGSYDFEIQITDKNKSSKATPYTQNVQVDFSGDKPVFSGIQLVKSYTKTESVGVLSKSGYDLVPYVFNYFPENENQMIFYFELYNMDKVIGEGQKYLLSYYIETYETGMKLPEFAKVKKNTASPVDVELTEFSITDLASGNYNLVAEARDQKNQLVAQKKLFIQRRNPNAKLALADLLASSVTNTFVEKITNMDTLKEYISCTFPIATGIEQAYIKESRKSTDMQQLQQFFYTFWQHRDASNPENAWIAYHQQVKIADYNFKTPVKRGYQTDRGYIYLKYGPPNVRSEQYYEPSAYPYEIWQYYVLNNNQRNRKFVFYSPDMVTSDFYLLHSDATGEVNDPAWQIHLQNRVAAPHDLQEDVQSVNSWGSFSNDYWTLPN
jgi:GWxTD domain-containing protein